MSRPRIIGLVGRARSGKDTAASFMGPSYTIRRLATPIKKACQEIYGWDMDRLESNDKELVDPVWDITPRRAMVHMTNSIREFMGLDFFTRRFFESWDGSPIVIPDVRYQSDVSEIHRRGGVTIKILRVGTPCHSFESEVDDLETSFTIRNDGTIDEFRNKVIKIFR
jgi:hypothetical protein